MKSTKIVVESPTIAMKLRKLLAREKVEARLIKLANTEKNTGCAHGIEIKSSDLYSAVVIMRENNIVYSIIQDR